MMTVLYFNVQIIVKNLDFYASRKKTLTTFYGGRSERHPAVRKRLALGVVPFGVRTALWRTFETLRTPVNLLCDLRKDVSDMSNASRPNATSRSRTIR